VCFRSSASESARPKLLLVDDQVPWAARLAGDLGRIGLDVRTCHDGPSAIAALQNWPADVVLLDERMPGMGGHEVCRRMRAGGYSGAILIYSAYDTDIDVVLAHEAGADDHVSKAASPTVVHAKIRRAFARVRDRPTSARSRYGGHPCGMRDLFRDLEHGQRPVDWGSLTRLDERLLCRLVLARGSEVSQQSLLLDGWGDAGLPVSRLYEPISNLREKLAPLGWGIQNIRGKGYRLVRGDWDEASGDDEGMDRGEL
jgi:DNA-binding response OmpR family regulator